MVLLDQQAKIVSVAVRKDPYTVQQGAEAMSEDISFAHVSLDDLFVHPIMVDEHIASLQKVFAVMSAHKLGLKIFKMRFPKNQVGIPGHIVSSDCVAVTP